MSDSLYPLRFKPRFVEKMWGGRKLETILGKKLPSQKPIGESWELYDFPPGTIDGSTGWVSAEVENGPLAGKTLHALVESFGRDLYGDVSLVGPHGQFPILIKFLDAREDLSIQVHPDQKYADTHPGAHLKSEAWYIFQSDPNSKLYKGLKAGVTRDQFAAAIKAGNVDQLIETQTVKEGQCFYLESGTVHALGAGIFVAEVQTPSDTTYRVSDFNRVDPSTGKLRKLHVDESLDCIDFSGKHSAKESRSHVASYFTTVTRLTTSPYFTIEKVRMTEGVEEPVPYDQPVVWMMLEGNLELRVSDLREPISVKRGETILLPAKMNKPMIRTLSDCVWLETTFPIAG